MSSRLTPVESVISALLLAAIAVILILLYFRMTSEPSAESEFACRSANNGFVICQHRKTGACYLALYQHDLEPAPTEMCGPQ